jgi:hypothetical protein
VRDECFLWPSQNKSSVGRFYLPLIAGGEASATSHQVQARQQAHPPSPEPIHLACPSPSHLFVRPLSHAVDSDLYSFPLVSSCSG